MSVSTFVRDFLDFSFGGYELRCDPNGIVIRILRAKLVVVEEWLVFLCTEIYLIGRCEVTFLITCGLLYFYGMAVLLNSAVFILYVLAV